MLRTPRHERVNRSAPVSAGPKTSPMLPPTPCIDKAEPRRSTNLRDKAAAAGRCHMEAAAATILSDSATASDSTASDVNTFQENPDPEPIRRLGPPNLDGIPVSSASQAVGSNSGGMRQSGGPDGEQLPARYIVVLLEEPLSPGTTYHLAVSDLEILYGLSLGSGGASLFMEPVAITDTATVMDSILVPDTGPVASASLGSCRR